MTNFKADISNTLLAVVPDTLSNQCQFGRPVKATKVLLGPGGKPLKGKDTAILRKNNTFTKEVYAFEELCMPLLG